MINYDREAQFNDGDVEDVDVERIVVREAAESDTTATSISSTRARSLYPTNGAIETSSSSSVAATLFPLSWWTSRKFRSENAQTSPSVKSSSPQFPIEAHGRFAPSSRFRMLRSKVLTSLQQVPPRYRALCFAIWIAWKFVLVFGVTYVLSLSSSSVSPPDPSLADGGATPESHPAIPRLPQKRFLGSTTDLPQSSPLKVLYIVTSLAEFDSGHRATTKGKDRLGQLVLPVLVDSVESLIHPPYQYDVDVYLIVAYTLSPSRNQQIRDALPPGVGLQVWDDACPLGYDKTKPSTTHHIGENTRALARQHRYVIKDQFPYYDLFVAFEDDMRITGAHVSQFMTLTQRIELLRQHAIPLDGTAPDVMDPPQAQPYFGAMTPAQLDRLIPGFVRVEVLLNATVHGAQLESERDPIPLDYHIAGITEPVEAAASSEHHFDPRPCCQLQMHPNVDHLPIHPRVEDVVVWETSVRALSVRQLPTAVPLLPLAPRRHGPYDHFVALLPGPGKRLDESAKIGGYWSGREGAFGAEPKPSPGMPDLIAQQGGWMANRHQLFRLQTQGLCQGSFLPPFNLPIYRADGQESMNVEFYSGGYQLFTGVLGGCNMQRVVSLHPDEFSSHFLYHVANNKQRQLGQKRMVRADVLWAQLNYLRNRAAASIPTS